MYCQNCGAELGPKDKFCQSCGAPAAARQAADLSAALRAAGEFSF